MVAIQGFDGVPMQTGDVVKTIRNPDRVGRIVDTRTDPNGIDYALVQWPTRRVWLKAEALVHSMERL